MSGVGDAWTNQELGKLLQKQAVAEAEADIPDGSAKARDYRAPTFSATSFPDIKGGSELMVNRDGLSQVATNMGQDLSDLQGMLQQLNDGGAGGGLIGGWETADAFGSNAGSAYYGISTLYQKLNAAYDLVIGNIGQTVRNYADAESETEGAANSVGRET
jgi:uncharacterized protein YukE